MKKTLSLNRNNDFRRLYAKGDAKVHPILVCYRRKNRLGVNRLGITASKKIGNACCRNRARRVIREAYRLLEDELLQGWDLVFVARTRTALLPMQSVQTVMRAQLAPILRT